MFTVSDLQSDVAISRSGIVSGELKFINEYPSFESGENEGNFLAIHADLDNAPVGLLYTITVTSGDNEVVDFDNVHVIHVTDKDSQTVTVVASATGLTSVTKTLSLTDLTCLEE